jgi:hypothetical protein
MEGTVGIADRKHHATVGERQDISGLLKLSETLLLSRLNVPNAKDTVIADSYKFLPYRMRGETP